MIFDINTFFKIVEDFGEQKAFEYKNKFVPDYIYKFFWLNDEYDRENNIIVNNKTENEKRFYSLENKQIWFDLAENQNDPYEFAGLYLHKEKFGENEESFNFIMNSLRNSILLSAFTDNAIDNLPMWSHYTNNHKGYCVKYKVNNKTQRIFFGSPRRAEYKYRLHFVK